MSTSVAELNAFHHYATQRLQRGDGPSLEDCLEEWRAEQEREEAQAGVLAGIADVDAGRLIDLEEFDREFRKRHGIPDAP